MLYASNGGFTHSELYEMPVYLRNFYYKQLVDALKQKSATNEKMREEHERLARSAGKTKGPGGGRRRVTPKIKPEN